MGVGDGLFWTLVGDCAGLSEVGNLNLDPAYEVAPSRTMNVVLDNQS